MKSLIGWARMVFGGMGPTGQHQATRLGPYHSKRFNQIASKDGLHYAYVPVSGKQVVHDAKAGKEYDSILEDTIVFNPDGRRLAYGAHAGGRCFMVLDGQVGSAYDAVLAGTIVFSPDGRRLAYGAHAGGRCFMVLDGQV